MMTDSGGAIGSVHRPLRRRSPAFPMSSIGSCFFAALVSAALGITAVPAAVAQGTEKQPDQPPRPPGTTTSEPSKDDRKKVDEFAEAARVLGGPAARPECVWVGKRVVSLLWRDD